MVTENKSDKIQKPTPATVAITFFYNILQEEWNNKNIPISVIVELSQKKSRYKRFYRIESWLTLCNQYKKIKKVYPQILLLSIQPKIIWWYSKDI